MLTNVPRLNDVRTMQTLLAQMGVRLDTRTRRHRRRSTPARIDWPLAPYELVKTMRASILVLGPLLARCGEARVSLPGGCAIGLRPVDQHVKGLQAMGAEIDLEHGYINARARRLKGARFVFDLVTVTGTENLMMAATLAEGTTVLENAAREPEVVDLARCLIAMGARIDGRGHRPHRDRGRAARCTARRTRSCPTASRPAPSSRRSPRPAATRRVDRHAAGHARRGARQAARGRAPTIDGRRATRSASRGTGRSRAFNLRTAPYPGFPTDMQAQMMALADARRRARR